jgi:protein disulfide-isomerase
MSSATKPLWVIFAALVAGIAISSIPKFFESRELVKWKNDLGAAKQQSRENGKSVLVYFTATWCGPCQRMKSTTFADAEVDAALQQFVAVKVDIDAEPGLAREFGVSSIPHFVILSPAGSVQRMSEGYLSGPEFLQWLQAPVAPTTHASAVLMAP